MSMLSCIFTILATWVITLAHISSMSVSGLYGQLILTTFCQDQNWLCFCSKSNGLVENLYTKVMTSQMCLNYHFTNSLYLPRTALRQIQAVFRGWQYSQIYSSLQGANLVNLVKLGIYYMVCIKSTQRANKFFAPFIRAIDIT